MMYGGDEDDKKSTGSLRSKTSTKLSGNTADLRKQKFAVWYKLGVMISFPLVALLCLAATLVVNEITKANAASNVSTQAKIASKLHKTVRGAIKERGLTNVVLASGGTVQKDELDIAREDMDVLITDFDAFLLSMFPDITHDNIIKLSMLSGLFHDLDYERDLVDKLGTTATEAEDYYGRVIIYGNKIIREMVQVPEESIFTSFFSVVANWVFSEDWTGKLREDFARDLAHGEVTITGLQTLSARKAVRDDFVKMAVSISSESIRAAADALIAADESVAAASLIQSYVNGGTRTNITVSDLEEWFQVQAAYIDKKSATVTQYLVELQDLASAELESAAIREALALGFVFLCTSMALILAFITAGSVAAPFVRLSKIKAQLTVETLNIQTTNDAVGRFVPFEMLEILQVADVTELSLGYSVTTRMTVLFGDIISFTTLSTTLGPDEVFKFLNSWLASIIPIIQKEGGVVDKFLGDGIMSFFHQPIKAANAGVSIFQWAHQVNHVRSSSGALPLAFGLGANTGEVSIGTIGSTGRMETTSNSEAVDIGNQVEASTRNFKSCFMLAGNTVHAIDKSSYQFRLCGFIKGKKKAAVPIFECLEAIDSHVERQAKVDTIQILQLAVEAFEAKDYEKCRSNIQKCLKRYPEDGAALHYMKLLEKAEAEERETPTSPKGAKGRHF